jgi:hypothetical protein
MKEHCVAQQEKEKLVLKRIFPWACRPLFVESNEE